MLPSTGYFKGLRCPFYDSSLCERPHCHFRHVKRESLSSNSGEGIKANSLKTSDSSSQIHAGSIPSVVPIDTGLPATHVSTAKATYNPTPIAELIKVNSSDAMNGAVKRHIPVPYTPRKPTSIPLKRPFETDVEEKLTYIPPAKYQPGSTETPKLDPYTPSGSSLSNEKYLPGTQTVLQEYKPVETNMSSNVSYIPSDTKSINKKKILEYEPAKVKPKTAPSVIYQPTPKSIVPCFSSDEEEPEVKKCNITSDLNELDDLGPEFDILDQILDEEKDKENSSKTSTHSKIDRTDMTSKSDSNKKNSSKSSDEQDKNQSNKKSDCETKDKHNSNRTNSSDKHSKSSSSSDKIISLKSSRKNEDTKHKAKTDSKSNSSNKNKDKEISEKERDRHKDKKSNEKAKSKEKSKDKEKDKITEREKGKSKDKDRDKDRSKETDRSKDKERSKDRNKDRNKERSKEKHKSKERDKERSKEKKVKERQSKSRHSEDKSKHKTKHISDKSRDKTDKDHKSKSKHKPDINEYDSDDSFHRDALDSNFDIDVDELIEDISESDEESRALECKRIFEEYIPEQKTVMKSPSVGKETINDEEEYVPLKKRISLAAYKNIKVTPKPAMKPDYKVGASQMMAARLAKVREYHATKKNENYADAMKDNGSQKNASIPAPAGNSKIRIAHVPYASSLMSARKSISTPPVTPKAESCSSTSIQTVKKGANRVAHLPNDKFIDRPGVLEPLASKIPANIRSTYLNMMIDECLKIYLTAPDAYARAQHEELNTSKKCKAIQIYKNSALLAVSRLRKEFQECNGIKKSASECKTLQSLPSNGSWSVLSKNRRNSSDPNEMKGAKLFENISRWILTEEQLRENGFPRSHPDGGKGRAMIYSQNRQKPPKGFIRTCCRCKKDFTIGKKGFAVIKEECIYHPNNKYRFRGEVKYQCCSQDGMSDGCCMAPSHVYEYVDYDNLTGFVKTMPPIQNTSDYGVYALDCEMCYTTHGLDLTRITVIDSSCKVIYETLIRPLHPIVDYNTRYSGITEEQMAGVKTTLLEVQATLLTMFSSKTILIGHSLESDFKALKLIHDTVIDTSVLFPHKMGPPYKRALRNLSTDYLKKIIQNSVEGHDSAEDATVCMELIHYKLKEDLKVR